MNITVSYDPSSEADMLLALRSIAANLTLLKSGNYPIVNVIAATPAAPEAPVAASQTEHAKAVMAATATCAAMPSTEGENVPGPGEIAAAQAVLTPATTDDIKREMKRILVGKDGAAKVQAIFATHGASKLTDIKPDRLAAVFAALKEV